MAKQTLTMTTNTTAQLADVIRRSDAQSYGATIFVQGTFGGGTATVQVSPDSGTTKYTIKDVSGTDITGTSAFYYNFVLGNPGAASGDLEIYVTLSGATSPSLSVILFDNR